MTDIQIEMNFYRYPSSEWVVMVLWYDEEGDRCSKNWYFKSQQKAAKQMATLEQQYNVKGTVHA